MVRKPPDTNSFIEVDPFDVFLVEGDIDRLDSQRFEKDKIRRSKASQGIRSNRLIDDQKVDTEAQRLILDVRYAQQQALKDLYAIGGTSGLVIPREMTDSDGPEHQRIFSDSAGPENQRNISDTDGPVLPSVIRLASLREPVAKARHAQQNALKEIHAIKDMIFSSSAQRKDRLPGPLEPRKFSDANGPILPPLSSSRHDPEDRKNLSLDKLLERIKKAHAEQQASLKCLHAMQDADGPQNDRTMSDLDLRLVKASQSQLTAMGYLKRLEDVAGALMAKHWSDSTRETEIKDRSDAAGPIRAHNSDDAQGPVLAREAVDAEGPAKLREATDASGPLLPRQAIDAAGPNAPNSFDDAVGPTDRRLITDAKGPTLFHRIIEAVLPKKAVSVVKETPIEIEHHQSSIAERIAKVKADQRDAMQQLGELEKDNDKPLL
jgi:hypothetical protein